MAGKNVVFDELVRIGGAQDPGLSDTSPWVVYLLAKSAWLVLWLSRPPTTIAGQRGTELLFRIFCLAFLAIGVYVIAAHEGRADSVTPDAERISLIAAWSLPALFWVYYLVMRLHLVPQPVFLVVLATFCWPLLRLMPALVGGFSDGLDELYYSTFAYSAVSFPLLTILLPRRRFLFAHVVALMIFCVLFPYAFPEGHRPTNKMHTFAYLGFVGVCSSLLQTYHLTEAQTISMSAEETKIARRDAKFKSQFLATMSHELRTPLNGILGGLDLLQETSPSSIQEDYISMCQECTEQMLTLVNDFLDVSKIAEGKLKIDSIVFEIATVVDNVLSQLYPRALKKKVELISLVDPFCPSQLIGDPARLKQVLLNLVGNATKFTQIGHVLLRIFVLKVAKGTNSRSEEVNEERQNRIFLRFEVIDTGIGISEADQQRLFTRFTQVDNAHSRRFDGTGLGLAICKDLVELMGGEVGVMSKTGKGSTFWFTAELGYIPSANADASAHSLPRRSSASPHPDVLVTDAEGDVEMQAIVHRDGSPRELIASFHPFLHMHPYGSCEIPNCTGPEVRRRTTSDRSRRSFLDTDSNSDPPSPAMLARTTSPSISIHDDDDRTLLDATDAMYPPLDTVESFMAPKMVLLLKPLPSEFLDVIPATFIFDVFICHSDKQVTLLWQQLVRMALRYTSIRFTVRVSGTLHGSGGWAKAHLVILDSELMPWESLAALLGSVQGSSSRTIMYIGHRQRPNARGASETHLIRTLRNSRALAVDRSYLSDALQLIGSTPLLLIVKPLQQFHFLSAVRCSLDIIASTFFVTDLDTASPLTPPAASLAVEHSPKHDASLVPVAPVPILAPAPAPAISSAPAPAPVVSASLGLATSNADSTRHTIEGRGTALSLSRIAPLISTPSPTSSLPSSPSFGSAQPQIFVPHILAAEDNEVNQKLLTVLFRSLHVEFKLVGNGLECVQAYRAAVHDQAAAQFNMILMDCQMPVMDGYDAAREIRALEKQSGLSRVPIVACTADATEGAAEACKRAGMDAYITKPVRKKVLEEVIEEWAVHVAPAPPRKISSGSRSSMSRRA